MNVKIFEGSAELPREPYLKLLLIAAFPRSPSEQLRIGEEFRDSPSHAFWVAAVDDRPVGGCAVIESDADLATIRYLGVEEPFRRCGIGRQLVDVAIQRTHKRLVEAETDDNAKDFYRKCGFAVRRLGEKYPGIVRYVCTYAKPADIAP